jgi:hypothetical protein
LAPLRVVNPKGESRSGEPDGPRCVDILARERRKAARLRREGSAFFLGGHEKIGGFEDSFSGKLVESEKKKNRVEKEKKKQRKKKKEKKKKKRKKCR